MRERWPGAEYFSRVSMSGAFVLLRPLARRLLYIGKEKERRQDMLLLLILLILILAAVPAWPYSRGWGYYPSGGLGTILVILIVLMLLGFIHI